MAETALPTNSRVIKWERDFNREYIRDNRFSKITGADERAPIQIKEQLGTKPGKTIDIELVNRARGAGKQGGSVLEGHEEEMAIRNFRVEIGVYRHAVLTLWQDEDFSAIDLVEAKDVVLKDWAKELQRDRILNALGSMSIDGVTHHNYADADETSIKDVWLANNSDRVLFGAAVANNSGNDHSASLLNVDTTADTLVRGTLSLLKRLAKNCNPKIRPIRVRDDEEWFVVLAPSKPFADLQENLSTINSNAETRGKDNPLFTGGDLLWDGMIIKEVPEIGGLGTVGGSSANVAPVYLLGAQAIAHAIGRRPHMIKNDRDYGERKGAGVRMVDEIRKIYYGSGVADADNPKQNGVATLYVAYAGT